MAFPTLSTAPLVSAWREGAAVDPTIRSSEDSGLMQVRAGFTRIPWQYHLEYGDLTQADKDALKAWEKNVKVGCDIFNHPNTGAANMRLSGPIQYRRSRLFGLWTAALELEEV
jgi:hypothetical protein